MALPDLFDQVVRVTYIYLGPAADRFVARQISNHLHKNPHQLKRKDMADLIDWIQLAMGFLTEDQAMIDEYISRLKELKTANPKRNSRAHAQETTA